MKTAGLNWMVLIAFVLFFVSCKKENVSTEETVLPSSSNSSYNVDYTLMLQLVNKVRQSGCTCGTTVMPPVNALTWNNRLALAAYDHSKDMKTQNYFSHTGKNGTDPGVRITNAGYTWNAYGENIALGYPDEQAVMKGWLNSEGHCKNIMSLNFKEMGAGREGDYWTQEFGKQ